MIADGEAPAGAADFFSVPGRNALHLRLTCDIMLVNSKEFEEVEQ